MAVAFDGSNDRIEITRYAALESTKVSLSAWLRRNGAQAAGDIYFAKAYNDFGLEEVMSYGLRVGPTSGETYVAAVIGYSGGRRTLESASGVMTDLTWKHVVMTYDPAGGANELKLYVDGVLNNSASYTDTIIYDTTANGMLHIDEPFWDCKFDGADCRVYNRVLSLPEIETIYKCRGTDGIVHGLTARFFLRQGSIGSSLAGVSIKNLADGQNGSVSGGGNAPVWSEDPLVGPRRRAA